jgi:hypothetical protein
MQARPACGGRHGPRVVRPPVQPRVVGRVGRTRLGVAVLAALAARSGLLGVLPVPGPVAGVLVVLGVGERGRDPEELVPRYGDRDELPAAAAPELGIEDFRGLLARGQGSPARDDLAPGRWTDNSCTPPRPNRKLALHCTCAGPMSHDTAGGQSGAGT